MRDSNHDADFYGWANEQAAWIRAGRLDAAVIESMERSERRELISRLTVVLSHLLKWEFQPLGRCLSWRTSIRVQRNALVRLLADDPSLKPLLGEGAASAYIDAVLEASDEAGLAEAEFSPACPWSSDEIIDPDFWPE